MKLSIPAKSLKNALLVAAHNDLRAYLNAVRIETDGKYVHIVASDGRALYIERLAMFPSEQASITVPRDTLEKAMRGIGIKFSVVLEFAAGDFEINQKKPELDMRRHVACTNVKTGSTVWGIELAGKFPNWRRTIPTQITGELAQYCPELLHNAEKACEAMGTKFRGVMANGKGAGIVNVSDDAIIVIMPYDYKQDQAVPTWVSELQAADGV